MGEIKLYKDINLQGESVVITDGVKDLNDYKFNDQTSSIKVKSGIWIIFNHTNFEGTPYMVYDHGGSDNDGLYLSPSDWGGIKGSISSIKFIQ